MREDSRASEGHICGITFTGSTGIEWICIKKVHATVYMTKKGPKYSTAPSVDRHYFVPRYPNRRKD